MTARKVGPAARKSAPAPRIKAGPASDLPEVPRVAFDCLQESASPLSAYDLIDKLQTRLARRLHPPTVYRALSVLVSAGLVHKLESANSYAPCTSPGAPHDSIHFLCNTCGSAEETVDKRVQALLNEDASRRRFTAGNQVIEIHGVCRNCRT